LKLGDERADAGKLLGFAPVRGRGLKQGKWEPAKAPERRFAPVRGRGLKPPHRRCR